MNKHSNAGNPADQRPVVVFGNLRSASLAWYCLTHDSPFTVAGFTVDGDYLEDSKFEGLPLVSFETLEQFWPPDACRLLIPMGYQQINGVRRARYENAKARGYDFVSYVSSRASIWPDLKVGENVLIYEHAIIQPFSSIGNNCIIRSGAHISHHCTVGDHAFVAAEVAMGGAVQVGEQAFIGIGATLRDQISIAGRTFIGAGAVVVKNTEENSVYIGNPARKSTITAMEASSG